MVADLQKPQDQKKISDWFPVVNRSSFFIKVILTAPSAVGCRPRGLGSAQEGREEELCSTFETEAGPSLVAHQAGQRWCFRVGSPRRRGCVGDRRAQGFRSRTGRSKAGGTRPESGPGGPPGGGGRARRGLGGGARDRRRTIKCAVGQVMAKTGTLTGAVALSGLTKAQDGEWKVFSFIENDSTAGPSDIKDALDGLAATVNGCWA
ncbi:D-alanyl-D-alanine carboxypeptidase [Streptomyces scabiei]